MGKFYELGAVLQWVFLLVLGYPTLCSCSGASPGCNNEELQVLLKFQASHEYSPWGGAPWQENDTRCCLWERVGCNRKGRVAKLDFGDNLVYSINSTTIAETLNSLLGLRYLIHLDLSGIECLQCTIPDVLGSMRQLRFLGLPNGIAGQLPHNIGHLTRLQVLLLPGWGLEQVDADIRRLSILVSLNRLDLTNMRITRPSDLGRVLGSLPHLSNLTLSGCGLDNAFLRIISLSFNLMSNLKHLDLSGNNFFGEIPDGFQNATELEFMNLEGNYFSSSVPMWLGNYRNLTVLNLAYNELAGEILTNRSKLMSPSYREDLKNLRSLSLSYNNLTGEIPRWLFGLPALEYLDISQNQFSGSIPSSLYSTRSYKEDLKNLRWLSLWGNRLTGEIPRWLFGLPALENLDISRNQFSSIPSSLYSTRSCGEDLKNLRSLYLSYNKLSGGIPRWLFRLPALEYLDIFQNQFSSIPSSLYSARSSGEDLKNLWWLSLSNNKLSGGIPTWLSRLPALKDLDFSQNQLSGIIPPSLFSMPNLRILSLRGNQLNGPVPEALAQLSNLEYLDLSGNSLSGVISQAQFLNLSSLSYLDIGNNPLTIQFDDSWTPPFQLYGLGMGSCSLGMQLPRWLRTQKHLYDLDLANTSISAQLLEWIGESKLSSLNLSYSRMVGPIPDLPASLTMLDISHASISGPLPASIGRLADLYELYANDNYIVGSIPSFLCNMKSLFKLDLSKNNFSGSIPDCWDATRLDRMDFSFNNLSGTIPSSIKRLNKLSSLHLNNNHLSGEITHGLSDCGLLMFLDLGDNHLKGGIPTWMGGETFPILQILRLRGNKLSGDIPPQICSFKLLRLLDLSGNGFTGSIPSCLGFMMGFNLDKHRANWIETASPSPSPSPSAPPLPTTSIAPTDWSDHVIQVMKGINSDYTRTALQLITNLDLSSNSLVGAFPKELCNLNGLRGLNVSHNHLNGTIPNKIGDMSSVESLDLSDNLLAGNIPTSIAALMSLSHLNLSHNNLSGEIPEGSQMQTLQDPSIYADNPLLCADFLPRKCHSNAPIPQPFPLGHSGREHDHDKGDRLERMLLYTVVALGFGCGFWGAIGSLVLNSKWSKAYFEFTARVTDWAYVAVAVKAAEIKRLVRNSS